MPEHKFAGSMFYPGIAGFGLGVAHAGLDAGLVGGGSGGLAFLLLYPLIETYIVIVIFNRSFFYKQAATPIYFAIGGGTLAFGLAFMDIFRALGAPGQPVGEGWFILAMLALATAYVLFHASKGLVLGTYFQAGSRKRGVLVAFVLEAPFGALLLAGRFPGIDPGPIIALLLVYAGLFYYLTWHVFFVRRMPEDLKRALDKARKRARRVGLARERM
jgi:hypothetical protein